MGKMPITLEDVRNFRENNPLYAGEAKYDVGSREFFEEHRRTVIDDCFAGEFDERTGFWIGTLVL